MKLKLFTILYFTLIFSNYSIAQLCTGSLGDPIVNTTFGHGTNPGPSLSAATTNYQYVPNDCPNDGFYTVSNSTNACFSNSWHSFTTDHTGEPNGYFMLVNASIQPSAFYLDTVRGLCGSTTYEFAAWIMNVIVPSACSGNTIQPNLTFNIEKTDGTILQTYNTGNIPPLSTASWKQYGSFFTTPAAVTDVVLRIFNNSQGGCGNDLALDDITFRPCGPQLVPAISGMASNTVSFCEGTAGTFTFTCIVSGGFNIPTFQWQQRINLGSWTDIPAEITLSLTRSFPAFTPATIFQYRLAVAEAGNMGSPQCRIVSLPLAVEINANPVTTATNNGPVCEGNALILTSTGGAQYAWNGPNGFTATGSNVSINNLQLTQAGKYYVIVTNAAGCIHKDSTTIIINPAPAATTGFSNTSICAGDSVQLIAAGGLTYQWIPAEGLSDTDVFNPKASPAGSLQYSAIVTNLFACKDTAYVTVNVLKKPNANAGPDRVMIAGQPIQLSGSVSGEGYNFSWSPANYMDNSHSLQPIVNPPVDIKYILNVVSNFGCGTVSDTMFVKLYNDIFVPNAFSPNGDEINDKWNIPALAAYSSFEVVVYNRYGQIVFQTKNALKPWDGTFNGKPLPVGAYSYFINLGTSRYPLNGTVLIIR